MGQRISRRAFTAGAATVATSALARAAEDATRAPASELVRIGVIGLGNRGDQLLPGFLVQKDAEIAALCDVYTPYVEAAKGKVGGDPFVTGDYRRILDRKDIDAVVIATPDHWHALQFIHACDAGKDVYVEKPLSLVVVEGRRMIEAASRNRRITQMGVQRRSSVLCQQLVELIQSGAIGKVTSCHCYHIDNETPMGIGSPPDSDPPAGLDWDAWLGPAPKVPYNENRCFYKFRWFRDYSGGQLTNMGTHYLDMIQWALGKDGPIAVSAMGGKYAVEDNREIPDTLEVTWEYEGGPLVTFSQYNANHAPANAKGAELEFRGTRGTLYFRGGRVEVVPEVVRTEPKPALDPRRREDVARQQRSTQPAGDAQVLTGRVTEADHARNFLDGVKSRKPCVCPVEVGHRSTIPTLLGNIAYDLRRRLAWDPATEQFVNDAEANERLSYPYRAPYRLT